MRLIDADALLEKLNYQGGFCEDDEMYNLITNAPTVQHNNEVLEKCASVCDEMENEYGWGCVAASTIRLMKGKE